MGEINKEFWPKYLPPIYLNYVIILDEGVSWMCCPWKNGVKGTAAGSCFGNICHCTSGDNFLQKTTHFLLPAEGWEVYSMREIFCSGESGVVC